MAVGSRQILFSDSAAPAMSGQSPRQVSNLSDNPDVSVGAVSARNEPQSSPTTGVSAPASGSSAPPTISSEPSAPSGSASQAAPSGPAPESAAVQSEQSAQGGAGARVDVFA